MKNAIKKYTSENINKNFANIKYFEDHFNTIVNNEANNNDIQSILYAVASFFLKLKKILGKVAIPKNIVITKW